MKTIKQTYSINAPADKVWDAFINPETIDKWGGGPAVMEGREGFDFSLWDGEIHGRNTKVVPKKLIVQDWYSGDSWKAPSIATFTIKSDGDKTEVTLLHENIPDKDSDDIKEGWKIYYLGPMKKFLEG